MVDGARLSVSGRVFVANAENLRPKTEVFFECRAEVGRMGIPHGIGSLGDSRTRFQQLPKPMVCASRVDPWEVSAVIRQ